MARTDAAAKPKSSSKEFVFTFGKKHLGESLADVAQHDPSYIQWMVREGMHVSRPELGAAMRRLGLVKVPSGDAQVPGDTDSVLCKQKKRAFRASLTKEQKKQGHDSYVRVHQRSAEYIAGVQRSRQDSDTSLVGMARMTPLNLV